MEDRYAEEQLTKEVDLLLWKRMKLSHYYAIKESPRGAGEGDGQWIRTIRRSSSC